MKTLMQKDTCTPTFNATLFAKARYGSSLSCTSVDEWINIDEHTHIHTHTMKSLHSNKKEWNLVICDNMDGFRQYYAKWNKSGIERQIPYSFTYLWKLKTKQRKKTDS